MSRYDDQLNSLKQCIAEDRLTHAMIIQGSPKGTGGAFVDELLRYLYCGPDPSVWEQDPAFSRLEAGSHPDVFRIEPESKSRQILVDQIMPLMHRVQQSSYEGGWKVSVILFADRMKDTVQNKLLKTLEEPPPKSLLLLVTDSLERLLPTIRSRCQRIDLERSITLTQERQDELENLLLTGIPRSPIEGVCFAGQIKALLDSIGKSIGDELKAEAKASDKALAKDVLDARVASSVKAALSDVLRLLQWWHRDLYLLASRAGGEHVYFQKHRRSLAEIAEQLGYQEAMRRVNAVDEISARLEGNIPVANLLEASLG